MINTVCVPYGVREVYTPSILVEAIGEGVTTGCHSSSLT